MSEWRPIDTAPRTGEYLVFQPEYKHHSRTQYGLTPRICLKSDAGFVRPATHWHPLPDFPHPLPHPIVASDK